MPTSVPRVAWFVPVLGGGLAITGSTATLNGDEIATLSAASRSLPDLWTLIQHVDGHFLPYYLFMSLWVKAGTAELWLRLPSALAIAAATWFLLDLGRRLHSLTAGVTAGLLFALLPSVSYYGAYARPYALSAAAVVFSYWALHRATTDGRGWVRYGASIALVACTHLFAVLALAGQLALPRRTHAGKFAFAVAAGALPAAVLGVIGYGERQAIGWIPLKGPDVLLKFPGMVARDAAVGLILLVAATIGVALFRDRRWGVALAAWAVMPPLLLLALSHLLTPVYVDRYLFATAPALALLAGIAVAALPWNRAVTGAPLTNPAVTDAPVANRAVTGAPLWSGLAAGALVVATAATGFAAQVDVREPNGRFEDVPQAMDHITARPGDALLFGQSTIRASFDYYAGERPLPADVLRRSRTPERTGFSYRDEPDVAAALKGRQRVWIISRGTKEQAKRLPVHRAASKAGFTPRQVWHSAELPGITVALLVRRVSR